MDADLDTLCTVIYCTADDLLPEARANARRRITRRRAGHALRRPGDHGHPLRPQLPGARLAKRLIHLFPVPAHASRPTGGAGAGWPTRSSGSWASSQSRARASRDDLLLCDSTPVRVRAEAARRPSARPSVRPPATATAPPTRASTGAFASTCWPLPTAPHERSRWPIRGAASARWRSSCSGAPARGGEVLICDKGYAGREFAGRRCRPRRRRGAPGAQGRARPRAAPGAHPPAHRDRSSGPARTCSPWSATGRAPWPGCASASCSASSAWRPASASTTGWARPSRALVDYCA